MLVPLHIFFANGGISPLDLVWYRFLGRGSTSLRGPTCCIGSMVGSMGWIGSMVGLMGWIGLTGSMGWIGLMGLVGWISLMVGSMGWIMLRGLMGWIEPISNRLFDLIFGCIQCTMNQLQNKSCLYFDLSKSLL